MPKHRIDPDESLRVAQKSEHDSTRGKLKIYLGAAPGVGKTYEMLHDAFENRVKHLDVVVGIVESHGRELIESMLKDFEIIPRQEITYRGKVCHEFDLDATLKRNPGLVLVDEMAHTNAEGLRHAKRWQDIKELLDRGIDVYTTLNVQHIESLKDDVAQIIQAPIKETVPDVMIERADTIELIDLPVDELLKRLHEGKIYIPTQAEFAVEHYFKRGHLVALRELALRTTAAAVETEVLLHRKSEGIKKIWPTKNKILVCVGANPESLKLIRTAKQLANSLQAEWIAVYVDIPRLYHADHRRKCAIEHLRLAQQLGAETHVLVASHIVKEIIRFARERNVTQMMVWKLATRKWWSMFKRHLAHDLLASCGEIDVYIVTGEADTPNRIKKAPNPPPFLGKYYALAVGTVIVTTYLSQVLAPYLANSSLLMIYLLGVVIVSLWGHVGSAILASILSVLSYDFLFLTPIAQFKINDYRDILTLIIMYVVTQVISYFTLLKHRKAETAYQVQQRTEALYTLSQQLLSTRGLDALLDLGTSYIADIFKANVSVFLPNKHLLQHRIKGEFQSIRDEKEQSVAEWVYKMGQSAGLGTDTLSSSKALYLPLVSSTVIGVIKIEPHQDILYTPEQLRLLESCVMQLTLALEVHRLQENTRKKELKLSIDSARDSLLRNISEHLNFPLKNILALLRSQGQKERVDVSLIREELGRISLMNSNILQLIRFESQTIVLNKTKFSLHQLITDLIAVFKKHAPYKSIELLYPKTLPQIIADRELLYELFVNLLDNSSKFSPHDTSIEIILEMSKEGFKVSITNQCVAIDSDEVSQLFKKFYRGKKISNQQGLGLGLTLCQKIIEAHEGKIWAENFPEKGYVVFRFVLPGGDSLHFNSE